MKLRSLILVLLVTLAPAFAALADSIHADSIHNDPQLDQIVTQANELFLAAKFDDGIELLKTLEKGRSTSPAVPFFTANGYWWKIFRIYIYDKDAESTPYDDEFEKYLDQTISRSEQLLKHNPRDARALFYLGNAYCLKSRVKGLRGSYFGAGTDAAKGKRYLEQVLDREPSQYDAYYNLGVYNYLAGTLPGYAKFLKTLLFLPGGSREKGLSYLKIASQKSIYFGAESQLILARFYADFEETPAEALKIVEDFHKHYPENAWFHYWAGTLLSDELNNYAQAEGIYTEILDRCNQGAPSYTSDLKNQATLKLARVHSRLMDPERAVEEIKDLIATKPKVPNWILPRAYLELGNTYDQIGMRSEAIAAYTKVLAYPNHRDFHEQAKKLKDNENYNQKAATIYRLNLEGRRLASAGEFEAAEESFRKVLAKYPENEQTLYAMGEMYYLKADYVHAAEELNKVAARRPKEPKWLLPGVYVKLGQVYQARKQQDAAIRSYEKALDTDTIASDDRNLAKRRLREMGQKTES